MLKPLDVFEVDFCPACTMCHYLVVSSLLTDGSMNVYCEHEDGITTMRTRPNPWAFEQWVRLIPVPLEMRKIVLSEWQRLQKTGTRPAHPFIRPPVPKVFRRP